MSNVSNVSDKPYSLQLATYLNEHGYAKKTVMRYITVADRFQSYLWRHHVTVAAAKLSDVESYLKYEVRRFHRRYGRPPASLDAWYRKRTSPVRILLRVVQGQWPPAVEPTTPHEVFHKQLIDGYSEWLAHCRGLDARTIAARRCQWKRFLNWLTERGSGELSLDFTVGDVDAYLQVRAPLLRRSSRSELTLCLRGFLSYLFMYGYVSRDLSKTITGPTMYAFESIPSTLNPEQVRTVVDFARQDRTPNGLRTFAIVMLLSEYGLRAGEVVHLRLEDIDWRRERVRVHHSKTGAETLLPLLPSVGHAIFDYLRYARSHTSAREVFVRVPAPHIPLSTGSSLYTLIRRLLDKAGIKLDGKSGPHTFRHARAISLLRAAVMPKAIGDILGHRSAASLGSYLKLATDDLRAVGLEVPGVVKA